MADRVNSLTTSVIMPAYMLEREIAASIERVVEAIAELGSFEVVVSDDGSTDATYERASDAAARHDEVIVLRAEVNQGKGAALQRGFASSMGEIIVFLDADLDLPPEQVPGLVERLRAGEADVLVGEKLRSIGRGRYPLLRRLLSYVFAFVARVLFRLPVRETQTGLKVFRRRCLENTLPHLEIRRYAFDLELLVRIDRAGCRIQPVPVELAPTASSGRPQLRMLWEMGRDTIRIWWWSLRR